MWKQSIVDRYYTPGHASTLHASTISDNPEHVSPPYWGSEHTLVRSRVPESHDTVHVLQVFHSDQAPSTVNIKQKYGVDVTVKSYNTINKNVYMYMFVYIWESIIPLEVCEWWSRERQKRHQKTFHK